MYLGSNLFVTTCHCSGLFYSCCVFCRILSLHTTHKVVLKLYSNYTGKGVEQRSPTFLARWPGRNGSSREMCMCAALCMHAKMGLCTTVVLASMCMCKWATHTHGACTGTRVHAQTGCGHPCDAGSGASIPPHVQMYVIGWPNIPSLKFVMLYPLRVFAMDLYMVDGTNSLM